MRGVSDVIALKVIEVLVDEGETWEDLVVELDVLSRTDHPSIVKYHGSWSKGRELMVNEKGGKKRRASRALCAIQRGSLMI